MNCKTEPDTSSLVYYLSYSILELQLALGIRICFDTKLCVAIIIGASCILVEGCDKSYTEAIIQWNWTQKKKKKNHCIVKYLVIITCMFNLGIIQNFVLHAQVWCSGLLCRRLALLRLLPWPTFIPSLIYCQFVAFRISQVFGFRDNIWFS